MHKGALICFGLAALFYLLSSNTVATGLGVIGALFEIAAWVIWISSNDGT